MNYLASIQDFFKSPKWTMNLLFSGICMLIPIVGPIVLMGWHITGFWMRKDDRPETFPDFDFGQFGKYLERGLWPFLAMFVASMVVGIVAWILIMIPLAILGMMAGGNDGQVSGILGAIVGLISLGLYLVMFLVMALVLTPLTIRATLVQDFATSFNFAWVKHFATLMWKEILLSALFMFAASAVLGGVGFIALCVGFYFAMGLVYYSWAHLAKQVYLLYLSRGGEVVPLSAKLADAPPPIQAA
jgi:Protein of unknown function (DUF4013)